MAWVKIDDGFADHPKMARVGPLGMALQVAALCYCNRYLTDGFIPKAVATRLISFDDLARPEDVISSLVSAQVWEEVEGGYLVHDYLEYQPSREQVLAEREKSRQRVQRHRQRQREIASNDGGNAGCNAVTNDGVTPTPVPVPEPSKEKEIISSSAPSGADKPRRSRQVPVLPQDSDAYRLAVHLRDAILARDPTTKVPDNLNAWAIEADRLLRIDGRDLAEAMRLIEWCQRDPFWSANILSMAKFRKQYDQLKRKAGLVPPQRASPRRARFGPAENSDPTYYDDWEVLIDGRSGHDRRTVLDPGTGAPMGLRDGSGRHHRPAAAGP